MSTAQLTLKSAAVIEALQEYFDKKIQVPKMRLRVLAIRHRGGACIEPESFEIDVEQDAP